ncbi:MAG: HAMP domain-containing histidine kinase [Clostridia bacterium]|nr:HAMP domain-containing histidine kinase [Clostridia bacterium]
MSNKKKAKKAEEAAGRRKHRKRPDKALSKPKRSRAAPDDRPRRKRIKQTFSQLLSNLHFSLTLRISVHFARQLLNSTFFMVLTVTLVLIIAQVPTVNRTMDALGVMKPELPRQYTAEQMRGLAAKDAYLLEEPLPNTLAGFVEKVKLAFADFGPAQAPCIQIYADMPEGPLVAVFSLEYWLPVYTMLFWALLCLDLYRAVYFLRHRDRLNKRVLKPIADMAAAAAALSANNLSNRFSIEGTKNELKDLAYVINQMLDRIERSYNSQKQFVSDASHELRTPIAVIQGYASMLERWGKTDKAVLDESIEAISQETTAMKELVERLLFLARHDKKTLMLEKEVFDPTEVMSSVHRDAKLLSPAHRFELQLRDSAAVSGDKGMLKQLMRILVDNAIKYTPAGGNITLAMGVEGEICVLSVTDTGEGISPKELPRIFDRFYRSDQARKAQSSGHGLGLSIARIIVVAHGGTLNVRSKTGVGSTFSVRMPVSHESRG